MPSTSGLDFAFNLSDSKFLHHVREGGPRNGLVLRQGAVRVGGRGRGRASGSDGAGAVGVGHATDVGHWIVAAAPEALYLDHGQDSVKTDKVRSALRGDHFQNLHFAHTLSLELLGYLIIILDNYSFFYSFVWPVI